MPDVSVFVSRGGGCGPVAAAAPMIVGCVATVGPGVGECAAGVQIVRLLSASAQVATTGRGDLKRRETRDLINVCTVIAELSLIHI